LSGFMRLKGWFCLEQYTISDVCQEWMDRLFAQIASYAGRIGGTEPADYAPFRAEVLLPSLRAAPAPLHMPLEIVAMLAFMRETEAAMLRKHGYWLWDMRRGAQAFRQEVLERVQYMSEHVDQAAALAADQAGWVQAALERLHDLVFSNGTPDLMDLYRYVWWHAYSAAPWMEAERIRLEQRAMQHGKERPVATALLHHAMMRSDESEAMRWLSELDRREWASALTPYFSLFAEQAPDRHAAWLRKLKTYTVHTVSAYSPFEMWYASEWRKAAVRGGEALRAEALETLSDLLPMSGSAYERLLVETEAWERWVDYCLYSGFHPLQADKEAVKTIQKQNPELLLPLYHAGIEKFVALKNRESYRYAARLLGKLAKLYKKLKRLDDWHEYMRRFTIKYARLRALQEEIRKRKDIPGHIS
jgi:hypothetical protein